MPTLSDLQPHSLWGFFQSICDIPHPSGKEQVISKFVKDFGERLGFETVMDAVGNVLIRKPATTGRENVPGVILQGHLDMVPQKNSDRDFDFEKDSIPVYVDGEWVTAQGTTLGADNGIGVAAILAVLASNEIAHGPIEALFTVDEESGMTGAFGLQPGFLRYSTLINLDSEQDGEIFVGCAGGERTDISIPYHEEAAPQEGVTYRVTVKGLKGGHSGADIHLGRGNANKILNRVLWNMARTHSARLSSIDGGGLFNAIPRESKAVVVVSRGHEAAFVKDAHALAEVIRQELRTVEPDLQILLESVDPVSIVMDESSQQHLFNLLYAFPNGVMSMSAVMPGLVETSTNLARVVSDVKEKRVHISSLQRSSVDSLRQDLADMIDSAVTAIPGVEVKHLDAYPGWAPNLDSKILSVVKDAYAALFHEQPVFQAIHAGLECALFSGAYPEMDMVSFGPTIENAHSPDERVRVTSVQHFWNWLVQVLESI
ncbi:MAG: aminoacyl-histidine dipeptidase [Gammaproteobacteria bacterium]|nr:aminoacyl-histidine dipeptidase [Gammaproteobacteria bacterium]MBU1559187.1 aminoacyl-histidine dipeptidase [Gammaproteobacteria bacterium]MBU1926442.1 aminoacyl-histidine dipeptidase [Gammaproteobacteria bacterium]MBU2545724.1 aminoacyl-histidine dipeptidase [Gammaproteobacteria bacterium]